MAALVVWYLRKNLPESPRWLEATGQLPTEAEALLQKIEAEVGVEGRPAAAAGAAAGGAAPAPFGALFRLPLAMNLLVGCVCLITINTLLYGFVVWLPTFFVRQGLSIATSFGYSFVMALGAPLGSALGALTADRWGRKPTIIGASALAVGLGLIYPLIRDPVTLVVVGFVLTVPIYVLVALLFGIYIPELFPTELRLRGSGICNTFGRGATIVTPFLVVALYQEGGVGGVMNLMVALLVIQIVVVGVFGMEPARRRLEELQADAKPGGVAVKV